MRGHLLIITFAISTTYVLQGANKPVVITNQLIPEITTSQQNMRLEHPTYFIFAHGSGGHKGNVHYYHRHTIVRDPFFSFNFPDARDGSFNFKESNLAQSSDIAALKDAVDTVCQETQNSLGVEPNIVLTGASRGASSIIAFMGTHNPTNISALVIESPFDTVDSIIVGLLAKIGLGKSEGLRKLGHKIVKKYHAKYDKDAPSPLDMVQHIRNKELPILIICSKKDELIPWTSSYRLYEEFKNQGFTHVHIFISSRGKHVKILEDRYAHLYKEAVDAFYKKYVYYLP
jgi:alpha-beta hydrolase superfamily lysophospholipase